MAETHEMSPPGTFPCLSITPAAETAPGDQGVAQEIPVGIYPTGVVDDQIHAGEGFETTGDLAWKPDVVLVGEEHDALGKTGK